MRNKASLLLMEQLIMLLVFALTAAVCLQGFAYASQVSRSIHQRENGTFLAQTVAEEVKNGQNRTGSYYYDEELNPVSADEDWCYRLELTQLPQRIPGLGQTQVQVENADARQLALLTVGWQEG